MAELKAELLYSSPELSRVCAAAMRSCYSSWPAHSLFMDRSSFPDSEVHRMLRKASELGHMDVLEHGFVTWRVRAPPEELLDAVLEHRFLYLTGLGGGEWLVTTTLRSLVDAGRAQSALLRSISPSLADLAPWAFREPPQSQVKQQPKEGYPEGPQVWMIGYTDFEELGRRVGRDLGEAMLWHGGFTFSISGVSRSFTHQLVRHRLAAYSQQSQRHVAVARGRAWYGAPPRLPEALRAKYDEFMGSVAEFYSGLMAAGARKEDARFVLPNAALTHITMTATAWEYRTMLSQRVDPAAQWEIRDVSWAMLALSSLVAPERMLRLVEPASRSSEVQSRLPSLLRYLAPARDSFRDMEPGEAMEVELPGGLLEHGVRAYAVRLPPSGPPG